MSWIKKIIEDPDTQAEKSLLSIISFGVALAFGICALFALPASVEVAKMFLWFSAGCLGIGVAGAAFNKKKNENSK